MLGVVIWAAVVAKRATLNGKELREKSLDYEIHPCISPKASFAVQNRSLRFCPWSSHGMTGIYLQITN
jgi:hypothetical protein